MTNIDERAELLSCPFCGGESVIDSMEGHTGQQWFPSCQNDDCVGWVDFSHISFATKREATSAWNTRATLLTAEVSKDEVARVMAEGMEPTYSDTYSSRELIEKALRALSDNGYKVVRK
jgi:hypothetical protein